MYKHNNFIYLYTLCLHLGNVRVVSNDIKSRAVSTVPFTTKICNFANYYPFGMQHTGTAGSYNLSSDYRYGYNGKEKDDEIKGEANSLDYGFRIYDPRVGKFLSVDPLKDQYPWFSPFQFAGNSPILNIDIDGLEPLSANSIIKKFEDGKTAIGYKLTVYVDQPGDGGDRDSYELVQVGIDIDVDVGHTFVKLEKVNNDGTVVSQTIGWYPSEELNPLEGKIESTGVITNDKGHNYDAKVTFELTDVSFKKVLKYVTAKEGKKYNLSTFNCTDFAQGCANASGNSVPDTQGSWPGGNGSNPGDLGEDLKSKSKETSNTTSNNNDKKVRPSHFR